MIDMGQLRGWVGRERSVRDDMSPFPAQALSAVLGRSAAPAAGEPLPPAWQWLYFLETPSAAATGPDGHVKLGGFLPPVPLPRRMWAAGRFEIVSPVMLGKAATRKTTIRDVTEKTGKSGTLVFVTLDHEVSQQGRPCIRERQDLVYREIPPAPTLLPPGETASATADLSRECRPDPVLLFRFSALTYNAHRIHYDRRYAVEQEHYPGLVVHGPLLATQMLELLRELAPGIPVASYEFRALRPTFDLAPYSIHCRRAGETIALWTADEQGQIAMRATATLAQPGSSAS